CIDILLLVQFCYQPMLISNSLLGQAQSLLEHLLHKNATLRHSIFCVVPKNYSSRLKNKSRCKNSDLLKTFEAMRREELSPTSDTLLCKNHPRDVAIILIFLLILLHSFH